MARQSLFTNGLLRQRQPELAGLQGHILIWVLGPLEHVLEENREKLLRRGGLYLRCCVRESRSQPHLDDAVHVWDEPVDADFQQHDQSPAHVLPDFTVLIASQCKQALDRGRGRKRKGMSVKKEEKKHTGPADT